MSYEDRVRTRAARANLRKLALLENKLLEKGSKPMNGTQKLIESVEQERAMTAFAGELEGHVRKATEVFKGFHAAIDKVLRSAAFVDASQKKQLAMREAAKQGVIDAGLSTFQLAVAKFRDRHQALLTSSVTVPAPKGLDLDEQGLSTLQQIHGRLSVESRLALLQVEHPASTQAGEFLALLDQAVHGRDALEVEALIRLGAMLFGSGSEDHSLIRRRSRELVPVVRLGFTEHERRVAVGKRLKRLEACWPTGPILFEAAQSCLNAGGPDLDVGRPDGQLDGTVAS